MGDEEHIVGDGRATAEGSEATTPPLVCATCGRHPDAGDEASARLTWSRDTSGAATTWTCDSCSREHLRSIEGKLDPAWW